MQATSKLCQATHPQLQLSQEVTRGTKATLLTSTPTTRKHKVKVNLQTTSSTLAAEAVHSRSNQLLKTLRQRKTRTASMTSLMCSRLTTPQVAKVEAVAKVLIPWLISSLKEASL